MKVYREVNSYKDFKFWGGALEVVEELTDEEMQGIWEYLEEANGEMGEREINELFWFDRDLIARLIGYKDFDDLLDR